MRNLLVIALVVVAMLLPCNVAAEVLKVSERDIINAIIQEFSDQGLAEDENVDLELFGGQTDFQLKEAKEVKILINNLSVDEGLGRFKCEAEIFADREFFAKSSLQGKFFLTAEVWVPAQNIVKGETINEDMLKVRKIRKSKLKPFMITEKEKLVGQEAKKSLKEDRIINDNDIGAKILVRRDDTVIAVYRTDKMQITTKAVALQDGAYGERIEVQNVKSRKTLIGVIQDEATVVIEQ